MKLEKKTKQIIFTAFFLLWAVILIFQFTDFDIRFQSLFIILKQNLGFYQKIII